MSFDENLINNPSKGMPRLQEIMRALRDPENGCPWDIEQNFKTIAPYTIEEAYEVADAIERENWDDLKNELGDLLLQTVYHTQIAEEENHHPDISFGWGYCNVKIFTHAIKGLAESDFILAAKIDKIN